MRGVSDLIWCLLVNHDTHRAGREWCIGEAQLLLHSREFSLGSVPDFDCADVRPDHVFQMCSHSPAVDLGAGPSASNTLCNLEDDACKPILIDPDFLVVGHLSQFAAEDIRVSISNAKEDAPKLSRKFADLTSAKCFGKSQVIAPPYRGVLR